MRLNTKIVIASAVATAVASLIIAYRTSPKFHKMCDEIMPCKKTCEAEKPEETVAEEASAAKEASVAEESPAEEVAETPVEEAEQE